MILKQYLHITEIFYGNVWNTKVIQGITVCKLDYLQWATRAYKKTSYYSTNLWKPSVFGNRIHPSQKAVYTSEEPTMYLQTWGKTYSTWGQKFKTKQCQYHNIWDCYSGRSEKVSQTLFSPQWTAVAVQINGRIFSQRGVLKVCILLSFFSFFSLFICLCISNPHIVDI